MSDLHLTPKGDYGKLFDITPASAGWSYVGFGLYRLKPGDQVAEHTAETEVILVLVEGKAEITAGRQSFGEMGARLSVFEKTPPHALYVPGRSDWSAQALSLIHI